MFLVCLIQEPEPKKRSCRIVSLRFCTSDTFHEVKNTAAKSRLLVTIVLKSMLHALKSLVNSLIVWLHFFTLVLHTQVLFAEYQIFM